MTPAAYRNNQRTRIAMIPATAVTSTSIDKLTRIFDSQAGQLSALLNFVRSMLLSSMLATGFHPLRLLFHRLDSQPPGSGRHFPFNFRSRTLAKQGRADRSQHRDLVLRIVRLVRVDDLVHQLLAGT